MPEQELECLAAGVRGKALEEGHHGLPQRGGKRVLPAKGDELQEGRGGRQGQIQESAKKK